MIKLETIHMLDRVVVNPVIKSASAVKNYDFITDGGELYLVSNTITGDKAYVDDVTLPAGEYLNGYLVKSLENQKLVVDGKHIAYADGKSYTNLSVNDILVYDDTTNKLKVALSAPASGVYFKITDKGLKLTEKAVKVVILVADNTGDAPITSLSGLTDVDLTTAATNGQVLKFNETSGKWEAADDATQA